LKKLKSQKQSEIRGELMEFQVIKKNGALEPFQREKIITSCMNAGATQEVAERVADEVAKIVKDKITTVEIRAAVLSNLSEKNPAWVMKYMEYELTKKK
jgi:transcriptional regulator NrdR family protein